MKEKTQSTQENPFFTQVKQGNQQFIRNDQIRRKDGFFVTANLFGTTPATAANYGVFFTAYHPCTVIAVSERHETAGSSGAAVTLQIEKLKSGQAPGAGVELLTTAFDLKSTANTPVLKRGTDFVSTKGTDSLFYVQLEMGDSLALKDSGTLTSVAGLQVTVYLTPYANGDYWE